MSVPIWTACEIWNKEGQSLLLEARWTVLQEQPQHGHLHHLQLANTQTDAHWDSQTRSHRHPFPCIFSPLAPSFSLSFQVVLEYLRCVIRHRFPSEPGRDIRNTWKVYKKRTLWIFDILCAAASKWVGWRGKEKQLQDRFFCLFSAFSPFPISGRWKLAQGHNSLILVYRDSVQGHEREIDKAKLILGSVLFSPTQKG